MIKLLIALIVILAYIYMMSKMLNQSINYKKPIVFAAIIFSAVITTYINIPNNILLGISLHLAIYIILTKILFNSKWGPHLIVNFICFLILGIVDSLAGLFMSVILGISFDRLTNNEINVLFSCLTGFSIIFLIMNMKYIINNLKKSIETLHIESSKLILYLSAFVLSISAVIMYSAYYSIGQSATIIITIGIVVTFFILFIMIIQEKDALLKKEIENEMLVNNLSEYEEMLEKNLINNHENKNSLIVIKGMVSKNNKKVKEYIDLMINERYVDDENLLYKTSKFPSGGLQGLVYQKILAMKSKNINFHLEIGKGISKGLFEDFDSSINYDICTIVGVLLDNSIEAIENLDKKNISIYAYISKKEFNISISNNFKGELNIEKIDQEGYSTKGKNRGFGLVIVKNILNKNSKIKLTREITGDVFKQTLTIKL